MQEKRRLKQSTKPAQSEAPILPTLPIAALDETRVTCLNETRVTCLDETRVTCLNETRVTNFDESRAAHLDETIGVPLQNINQCYLSFSMYIINCSTKSSKFLGLGLVNVLRNFYLLKKGWFQFDSTLYGLKCETV